MKLRFKYGAVLLGAVLLLFATYQWAKEPKESTEVVVIGAGASGMSAALEAHEAGLKVILLEKMPYVGGNTVRATAGMNAVVNEEDQADFIEDILKSGHAEGNPRMIEILAKEGKDSLMWLIGLGADLSDVGILAGHSKARTYRPAGGKPVGNEIVRVLKDAIDQSAVDLRIEHKALKVLLDAQGETKGVEVEDLTGKKYTIEAENVIIATGGFGGSPETFVHYNQKLKGYHTTNAPSATGDFITLVEDLDVQLVDMSYIQTHPTVSPQYGVLITEAIRGNGGILVNNLGHRFADELKNRDFLSEDILAQPDKEVYLIFNEAIRQSLSASDDYIDMNLVIAAPDVEALAALLRIDTKSLEETLLRYNNFVVTGVDSDFQRQSLQVSLAEGPFYAIQVTPAVHYSMGGILINENAEVLSVSGEPIKGLYASGEATGGIHGLNRLGGNSLLDAVVFGRIAGRSVAK